MKTKQLAVVLLSFLCFTACVDSNYDLSDVDSDDIVLGDKWTVPLGTGSITTNDVINFDKVPSLKLIEGKYVAIYNGEIKLKALNQMKSLPNYAAGMIEIASETISTGDINGLFDGDFVLALDDPHIKLITDIKGVSLKCNLKIGAESATEKIETSSDCTISGEAPQLWFGPKNPNAKDYTFIENKELPQLIEIVPQRLQLSFSADAQQFADLRTNPAGSLTHLGYSVEIPLAPAPNFKATTTERIEDAFDEDFIDYIFDAGSAEIYGDVSNDMPFNMKIGMQIVDFDNKSVGITFNEQSVENGSGKVSFKINEADMPKMRNARHIDLILKLEGKENVESLTDGQKITFKLKLKKDGGISI